MNCLVLCIVNLRQERINDQHLKYLSEWKLQMISINIIFQMINHLITLRLNAGQLRNVSLLFSVRGATWNTVCGYYRALLIWQVCNEQKHNKKMNCSCSSIFAFLHNESYYMLNSKLYSKIRYYSIDDLPFNKDIKIILDCSFGPYHGFSPSNFTIRKIGENLVRVTPIENLNTILGTRPNLNNNMSEPFKKVMELIQATQKTVKEISTTEPSFNVDQSFKYSFTLNGKTVEDIFHQINKMYLDIISQTSMDYSTLSKLYSARK